MQRFSCCEHHLWENGSRVACEEELIRKGQGRKKEVQWSAGVQVGGVVVTHERRCWHEWRAGLWLENNTDEPDLGLICKDFSVCTWTSQSEKGHRRKDNLGEKFTF